MRNRQRRKTALSMESQIKINSTIKESIVDGPGIRYVVFAQGCPHGCKGCHNPQTHDVNGGVFAEVDDIFMEIEENPLLSGVTFSGGEPFLQPVPLCRLAKKVRNIGKSIMIYTGYTIEHLIEMGRVDAAVTELLRLCDTLVDGPYIDAQRDLTLKFRGSANQRIIELKDYDFNATK